MIGHVVNLVLYIMLTIDAFNMGEHGRFALHVGVLFMAPILRSLMDIKYRGGQSNMALVRNITLNFIQLRPFYHWYKFQQTGAVGMDAILTRMCSALPQAVPFAMLSVVALLAKLEGTGATADFWGTALPIISFLGNVQTSAWNLMRFDREMLPSARQRRFTVLLYHVSDASLRSLAFGAALYTCSPLRANTRVPGGGRNGSTNTTSGSVWGYRSPYGFLGVVAFLGVMWLARAALFYTLYCSRGFVYPKNKKDEKPAPLTKAWTKMHLFRFFFSLFPAGYVQMMTDFPFNGDLSSERGFYATFQALTFAELATVLVFTEVFGQFQQIAFFRAPIPQWSFRACWMVLVTTKIAALKVYWRIKNVRKGTAATKGVCPEDEEEKKTNAGAHETNLLATETDGRATRRDRARSAQAEILERKQRMDLLFYQYSRDKGVLGRDQFAAAVAPLQLSSKEVAELFYALDSNKDGVLTNKDFRSMDSSIEAKLHLAHAADNAKQQNERRQGRGDQARGVEPDC